MASGVLKETRSVGDEMGDRPRWMRRECRGPKESRMVTERVMEGWMIWVVFSQLRAEAGWE
jgi:hypothetical protein